MEAVDLKITLQDIQPHLSRLRKELDSSKSGLLGDQQAESLGISLNKEGAIRRTWTVGSQSDVYLMKAFLDFFTDAKNVNDAGDNPMSYVVDPKVGDATSRKIVAPGTYRQAFTIVRPMANDQYLLVQELRLGWIENLVSGTSVDYSEARVETIDWYNASGNGFTNQDFITLVWKGVSPAAVDAIVESLKTLDPSAWTPIVNGNALISHYRLFVRSQEEADGSASVRVLLGNSRLKYTAYSDWNTERQGSTIYHFGVPSDLVQGVIDSEQVIGGTARVSGPDQRGLHDITISISDPEDYSATNVVTEKSCSAIEYMSMYLGLTQAAMEAITLGTAAIGETLGLRRQSRGDGYWDVIVTKRVTQTRNAVTAATTEISPSGTTLETQVLGYKEETIPVLESTTGSIKRRDIQVLPDCAKNLVTQTITPTNQTSQDKLENMDRTVVVDKNTEKSSQETVSGTLTAGTFERVQNDPTRAGNYATAKETHTAKDRVTEATTSRADLTETVEEHTATATEATVGSPSDFQTVTVENEESEYKDRFRTRKTTRTRANQTATSYDLDRTDERVTVEQTQADQPSDPGDVDVGRRVIVVTATETAKFDVRDTTETPREFDTGWVEFPNRQNQQVRVFLNSPEEKWDDTDWPYPAGNNVLRVQPKSNGRYDLTGYSEPDSTSIESALDSCSQTEVTTQVNASDTAVTIGSYDYNQLVEIRNVLLPNGSYQTTRTVRTFENQTGYEAQFTPTQHAITETNTNVDPDTLMTGDEYTPPTAPTVASGGGEVILRISPTQTCAKRVDQTTVTPIEFDTDWINYTTKWGAAYFRNILNGEASTLSGFTFPVGTENHERSFNAEPQSNGRYNISATARPNTAGGGGGLADLDNEEFEYTIATSQGTFLVEYKYTSNIQTAKDFITYVDHNSGALATQSGGAGVQAGIFYVGRGIFKAVSVTRTA